MNRLMTTSMATAFVLLTASLCIAAEMKPGPDYEQLKAMEWLIGDWEADWVVPSAGPLSLDGFSPGAKVHSTCSYYWMQKRNYIGLRFRDEVDGKLAHAGFEIVGVDPKSKKIIHWLFSIIGGNGTGEWSVEDKCWKLKWSGTASDGTTLEGLGIMVPIDKNTHTWQLKGNKKNGKDTPDT